MKKEKELDEQFGLRLVVRRSEETEPEKEGSKRGLGLEGGRAVRGEAGGSEKRGDGAGEREAFCSVLRGESRGKEG